MTTHTRSNARAMNALVIGSAFVFGALAAAVTIPSPASAARPSIVRDMCAGTSGGGGNMECNSADDLLVRPLYSDGTCGEWICCPPNGDGTYDCTRGSSPSGTRLSRTLREITGPRATIADPGERPTTRPNRPVNVSPARIRN